MSVGAYELPAVCRKFLARLPAYPGSVLFSGGLNLALAKHLPVDTIERLEGRTLRIEVRDAGVGFDFICRAGRFSAARKEEEVALTISASLCDFLLLAQRKEDPDTLFFSRRLSMEGDTELGLVVKNALDATDLAALLPLDRLIPAPLLRSFRARR